MKQKLVCWSGTVVLVVLCVLLVASESNRHRLTEQLDMANLRSAERERLEDPFEREIAENLVVGFQIDEHPYYWILVDQVVTASDFDEYAKIRHFIKSNADNPPKSYSECEFHKFEFWIDSGSGVVQCYIVVRNGSCVAFFSALTSIRPV